MHHRLEILLSLTFGVAGSVASRINVLLIGVDDLRPQLAGEAFGQRYMHTPNVERLMSRGTTFTRAYCQVPLCSPSRTSLLTGLRPDTSKVWTIGPNFRETMGSAGPSVVTLPQYFKSNGYLTTGAGKIFHAGTSSGGPSSDEGGADGGYPFQANGSWSSPYYFCDEFYNGTFQSPKAQGWPGSDANGCVQDPACIECLTKAGSIGGKPSWKGAPCADECYPDGAVAAEAIRQLTAYASKVSGDPFALSTPPFFLAVGFKRPHLGWFAPQHWFDFYANASIPLAEHRSPPKGMPKTAFSGNGEICGMDDVSCVTDASGYRLVPEAKQVELRRAYAGAVSFMDAQLGKVLDTLDATGLSTNTAVVFWGDHGYQLGEHGEWCKVTNFELATRVPLIVSMPGQPAHRRGSVSNAIVELLDIYPTLVDIADLPARGSAVHGSSLVPLLIDQGQWNGFNRSGMRRGGKGDNSREIAFNVSFSMIEREGGIMGISMRTPDYRYTEWVPFNHTMGVPSFTATPSSPELYSHVHDDGTDMDAFENENLAANLEYADMVRLMHDMLVASWDKI